MHANKPFLDGFDRVREAAHGAVDGLTEDQLCARLAPDTNTIAWLVWHLARVQDDHVAELAGTAQAWLADGWYERFGLDLNPEETGYAHSSHQVALVRADGVRLLGYLDAVHGRTAAFVAELDDDELDRVIDDSYDPPVTLGQRLMSVIADDLQHAGQAAFVKGVLES